MEGVGLKRFPLQLMNIRRRDYPNYGLGFLLPNIADDNLKESDHWVASFMSGGTGMYVEAFPNGTCVDLTISPATDESIKEWKTATPIELPHSEYTKEEIYCAFHESESIPVEKDASESCRKCMTAFLKKLGVAISEEVLTAESKRAACELEKEEVPEGGYQTKTAPSVGKISSLEEYLDHIRLACEGASNICEVINQKEGQHKNIPYEQALQAALAMEQIPAQVAQRIKSRYCEQAFL